MRLIATREDYFARALDVLAVRGHGALRIGSLCRDLGVTTGSFYHYFDGWDDFVSALLSHWEQEKTQRIYELAVSESDPVERIRRVKELTLTLPHEAESAIRAWAHVNVAVGAVQRRVDAERLEAVRTVIAGVIADPGEAHSLAVLGLSLLIGLQQWRAPIDQAELQRLLDEYEQLVMTRAAALAR